MTCACGCAGVPTPGRSWLPGHHKRRGWSVAPWLEVDAGYVTPCWIWQRATSGGYAQVRAFGRGWLVHRFLWLTMRGAIPPGLEPDHLCRNRACVNPAHLELVPRAENARRGARAKLTWEAVDEIRAARGVDALALAARFGVSRCTIYSVLAGKSWVRS